jgi:hypothetical protein
VSLPFPQVHQHPTVFTHVDHPFRVEGRQRKRDGARERKREGAGKSNDGIETQ